MKHGITRKKAGRKPRISLMTRIEAVLSVNSVPSVVHFFCRLWFRLRRAVFNPWLQFGRTCFYGRFLLLGITECTDGSSSDRLFAANPLLSSRQGLLSLLRHGGPHLTTCIFEFASAEGWESLASEVSPPGDSFLAKDSRPALTF